MNYGHGNMLDARQIEWIVRKKIEGEMRNEDIARAQNVSVRWVQHLFSLYRKTGVAPSLKKAGRPKAPRVTESERAVVLSFYLEFRMCACYLEQVLLAHNIKINHKRIHLILRELGMASNEPRKQRRRKWIRYEREHSNSLWHTDWHKIKDPRWIGQWLIAYEDDASRLITGYGVYPTLTSEYSVKVLENAVNMYGKPASILSDHGSTFYAVESVAREKGLTIFEKHLLKNKIRLITGRVDHPQTNGKIEKFFDIFEKKVKFFPSTDEFMSWYNCVRPHGAFDLTKLETPIKIFYRKLEDKSILTDPNILTRGEVIS